MKLSELIAEVGDENVKFQILDDDIVRISTKKDSHSEITFGTNAQTTLNGVSDVGLVVWLPRKTVDKIVNKSKEANQ